MLSRIGGRVPRAFIGGTIPNTSVRRYVVAPTLAAIAFSKVDFVPTRRVLLVDDHPGFVESARALLTHEGLDIVAVAGSAAEAIRLAHSVRPELMLLDIHLPDRSGIDVAHAVASQLHAPDVILISSDADAGTHPDVRAAPVRGFVSKRDLTCAAIEALLD